jgi:hypothetical protein
LSAAYEKYEAPNIHGRWPVYHFGYGNCVTYTIGGDVSAIEHYYAKCIDEAETKIQREHLRQQCERYVKRAKLEWEDWDRFHREAGLYDLEAACHAAEKALENVEETVLTSSPSSPQGVAAMIRVAMVYAWMTGLNLRISRPRCVRFDLRWRSLAATSCRLEASDERPIPKARG